MATTTIKMNYGDSGVSGCHVSEASPTSNKNSEKYMLCGCGGSTTKNYYVYLKFPIKTKIPSGSRITKATLSLYVYDGSDDWVNTEVSFICKRVTSSWTASSVTWDTKPTATTSYVNTTGYKVGTGRCNFTVTDIVQTILDANSDYGFVVRPEDLNATSNAKNFRKDTSYTNQLFYLEVTYEPTREGSVVIYTSSTTKNSYKPNIYTDGKWHSCDAYVYDGGWKLLKVKPSEVNN